VDGHHDGGFAEAHHEAIRHRPSPGDPDPWSSIRPTEQRGCGTQAQLRLGGGGRLHRNGPGSRCVEEPELHGGEAKPSGAGEAVSVRRSLSAILAFGPVAPGSGRDGVEAYQSFVVAPAGAAVEGHRDGRFAEAQREAIGDRR